MKKSDAFIQVLSEISGISIAEDPALLKVLNQYLPEDGGFDKELTEREADEWMTALREDKNAIRNWLGQGFFRALFRHADPMGIG
jgi:hypothetical protein